MAFSPDGKTLASGSDNGTVRLWEVDQPEMAPVVLLGHEQGVLAVAFSPDGKTLASGSDDGTVRLWAVGQPEMAPRPARPRAGGPSSGLQPGWQDPGLGQ